MPLLSSLLSFARHWIGLDPMPYEFENRFIFPRPTAASGGRRPFDIGYPPEVLLRTIYEDRDAVDGIGHIYVHSAKYCKRTIEAQHEFLVFVVKDDASTRQNTIIIDRVPSLNRLDNRDTPPHDVDDLNENDRRALQGDSDNEDSSDPIARGNFVSSSGGIIPTKSCPALDCCYVSAYGDIEAMTKRRGLKPYQCIANMTFTDKTFTVEKLLLLADTLSSFKPKYDLFITQCYWYAFMLWELMKRVHAAGTTTTPFTSTPFSHPYAPWLEMHFQNPERQTHIEELANEYDQRWKAFLVELPQWKSRGVRAMLEGRNAAPATPVPPPGSPPITLG